MATKTNREEGPGWFSDQVMDFSGRKCLNGIGPVPARIVFVDKMPTEREVWSRRPYTSKQAQFFLSKLKEVGFDNRIARFTYAMKHCPKKVTAVEQHWSERMFREELQAVDPEIIVCFGAEPLKSVVGNKYNWEDVHGAFFTPDSMPGCKFQVFATFNLEQALYGLKWEKFFVRDLDCIAGRISGTEIPVPQCQCKVVHTPQELDSFNSWISGRPTRTTITLDCEWHGKNWMDPDRYFRTVQMGYAKGKVVTLEVAKEGGERCFPCEGALFNSLKSILENPKVCIVGHNVIADGEWLLSYGIDIRPRVVYDTMLAEYIINQNGPFGLEWLSMKYTPYGCYSGDVETWVRRHKNKRLVECTENGFGYVPSEMLLKYGYIDVDCLWYIMDKQIPILKDHGCLLKRGPSGEYPSLLETTLDVQRVIYEFERNGMLVDKDRLSELSEKYSEKKAELLSKVMAMSRAAGMEKFNPRSSGDLRKMLFNSLDLTPVKTTDGDDWGEVVGELGMDDETDKSASTDKITLLILSGQHPFVDALLDFRKVDQICKQSLNKETAKGEPAGLYAHIWPDGRFHTHLSQITETGRFTSSAPNCQNFGKKAEGLLEPVFGKDHKPPPLRSIVVPPKGWVMIESDFVQAELFCMANLTKDQNMIKALTTPGLDLHDKTTVDSFGFHMFDENGHEISEDDIVDLAAKCGEDSDDFQHFMKSLIYVDAHKNKLTRAEFKGGPRISGKAINFGIPYGRGARKIAFQIKAETGDKRTIDEIANEMSGVLEGWKTKAFPTCWNVLQSWSELLYTQGYIENPFKRRKYGILRGKERDPRQERQFKNFNIQSTVGDVVQIAMTQMVKYREKTGIPFRMQNMIHDAVMIECPKENIADCKKMFQDTMAGIRIPIDKDSWFTLDVDIDVYERWGVKMKEA